MSLDFKNMKLKEFENQMRDKNARNVKDLIISNDFKDQKIRKIITNQGKRFISSNLQKN